MAVLAGGSYGLISMPPRARKLRCILPHKESKMCQHVKCFESNEGKEEENIVINDQNIPQPNQRNETTKEKHFSKPRQLTWPISKNNIEIMKAMAISGYQYENLVNLVPKYEIHLTCGPHGVEFDSRCPIAQKWVQSTDVKIFNTEYVETKTRIVYYRPTVTGCCKQTWTGEDFMLLNVSKDKQGVPVHLVSYNLLFNFSWSFSKMGGSERGFLSAHNNRMRFQYGMDDDQLLPWYVWNRVVKQFWGDVLELPLEKLFICDSCGPRPELLCMDGVAIGMMVENVKSQENLTLQENTSVVLAVSKFKDRVFNKQKNNRKAVMISNIQILGI